MKWHIARPGCEEHIVKQAYYIVKNNEDQWGEKPWCLMRGFALLQQLRWVEMKYRGEIEAFAKVELPSSISITLSAMRSGETPSSSQAETTCQRRIGRPTMHLDRKIAP